MINNSYCRLICFLVASIAATNANAELILRFGQSGGNIGASNINVTPGNQVQLDLFLTQTGVHGFGFSEDRLQSNALFGPSGLGIAGVVHATIQGSSAGGVTFSGSQANRIDGAAPALRINPGFVLQTGGKTFQESQFLSFDAFAHEISAGAVQPVFASSTRVAQFGFQTFSFSVVAVPEPSLLGLLIASVSAFGFQRRRR